MATGAPKKQPALYLVCIWWFDFDIAIWQCQRSVSAVLLVLGAASMSTIHTTGARLAQRKGRGRTASPRWSQHAANHYVAVHKHVLRSRRTPCAFLLTNLSRQARSLTYILTCNRHQLQIVAR